VRSIENGEGTLGKLVSSDSLYYDIDETVQSLDKLLLDIREHPERYVEISIFGGKKSRKKNK
jgi:phospholipid/cholesterol/gamma-HCH transport system substrate-binding protein